MIVVPFGILCVSEKSPLVAGVTIWSPSSVDTNIVESGTVFPLIETTFLLNTSSSFGESMVRKLVLSGVGVGKSFELTVVDFALSSGMVLVSWYR